MVREEAARYGTRPLIARAPLRSEVCRHLRVGLLRNDYPPGTGINEAELAATLGVSRTPLREALLTLEREGFVAVSPGRGFSVRDLTVRDAEEIYPILATLESLALRSAWPLPVPRIQELEQANRRLGAARSDASIALARDREWHGLLLADCPNGRLLEMIENLKDQAARYEDAFMRHSGKVILSVAQHQEVQRAARAKDLRAATDRLESNWSSTLEFLRPWLAERERR